MKKTAFTLASVLAAAAFAPEASAIPAFARQTGMACVACHQQHFPILNGFGQSFKASGYTLMGAQAKVEGEHPSLSIPDTLNAAILIKARYQKTNGNNALIAQLPVAAANGTDNGMGTSTNDGQWQFGDEFSLFFGGRVAENIGFLFEGNTGGTAGTGNLTNASSLAAGIKLPFMFDVGSAKVGLIPFSTDALGVAYGFELASTGAVRNVRWAENRMDISAQQYVATDGAASGLAFVARNDMGYVNYTRWSPNHLPGSNGQATPSTNYKSNYLRVAATPSVGDWAMHVGAQVWSGASEVLTGVAGIGGVGSALVDTKARAVDFQAFGNVGGNDLGVYATWAKSDASPLVVVPGSANANLFNAGNRDLKAFTIGADYSLIPHTLHLGAAYRSASNGGAVDADGDNSVTLMAVYDVAQNVALHVNYSARSGSAYNAPAAAAGGTTLLTGLLEMAW